MDSLFSRFDRLIHQLSRLLSLLVLCLALLCAGLVILRYGFNIGFIAGQEFLLYLHSTIFLLGFTVALQSDQHVRVDIFYQRLSARSQDWINLCCSIVFLLPICLFVGWESWPMVKQSWLLREGSTDTGGIQAVFLLKTLVPIAMTLLFVQGLALVLQCCFRLSRQ